MPIPRYPFLLPIKGGIRIGGSGSRPWLWIRVTNPETGSAVQTLALIDTGADSCVFPSEMAEKLGHKLNAGIPKSINTANRETTAFAHRTKIEVLDVEENGYPGNRVLYDMPEQQIDYTCGLPAFLLGQSNFLSHFILKINYPKEEFSIRFPQKSKPMKKIRRH